LEALELLLANLEIVTNAGEFERWVQSDLRAQLPHAAFLITYGMMLSSGRIPTHRLAVDFPLNIIEEIRSPSGSISDPLINYWMSDQHPYYVDLSTIGTSAKYHQWHAAFDRFGLKDALTHGHVDTDRQRFVVVQLFNPIGRDSDTNIEIIESISEPVSAATQRIIGKRLSIKDGPRASHPALSLTAAELLIVDLLSQGLSNKEIARLRGVSDATVKTQIARMGAKLGATRRAEIVAATIGILQSTASIYL
jgi:DNA-binding CsgD family transcriptional regulator